MIHTKRFLPCILVAFLFFNLSVNFAANHSTIANKALPPKQLKKLVEYFKVGVWEENVSFEWKLKYEENIREYILEYSADGDEFIELARKNSKGNSDSSITYEKHVYDKLENTEGIYRLIQVKNSGRKKYTEVKYRELPGDENKDISITIFPNPDYKRKTTMRLEQLEKGEVQIEVTDHRGYRIKSSVVKKGKNMLKRNSDFLDILNLKNGVYYLTVYYHEKKTIRKLYIK